MGLATASRRGCNVDSVKRVCVIATGLALSEAVEKAADGDRAVSVENKTDVESFKEIGAVTND